MRVVNDVSEINYLEKSMKWIESGKNIVYYIIGTWEGLCTIQTEGLAVRIRCWTVGSGWWNDRLYLLLS